METPVVFFTLLASFALLDLGWSMWKSTMCEILRDNLIDLRDEWRDHFARKGLDMATPAYAKLREMLNGQLRYTRHLRFSGFIYTLSRITPDDSEFLDEQTRTAFSACDEETRRLVESIRERSSEAVLRYIASTSMFIVLMVPAFAVARVSGFFARHLRAVIRNTIRFNTSAVECASRAVAL
ncbi:MAG: hypothetical protein IJR99_03135 [Kiritimatiellae bacterium]|nr:hypothetical protein [Kiritimatiellia bacterium]